MERSRTQSGNGQGQGLNMQREWFEKDYYATLGVSKTATAKEITKEYRKLARKFHPDANPNNASAEERFKEIAAAYDVLGTDETRKEYDEVRRAGPTSFGPRGPGGQSPGSSRFDGNNMGGDGISDLLGQMFGGGRRRNNSGVGPQRGAEIEASITLDFVDDDVHRLGRTTQYFHRDAGDFGHQLFLLLRGAAFKHFNVVGGHGYPWVKIDAARRSRPCRCPMIKAPKERTPTS